MSQAVLSLCALMAGPSSNQVYHFRYHRCVLLNFASYTIVDRQQQFSESGTLLDTRQSFQGTGCELQLGCKTSFAACSASFLFIQAQAMPIWDRYAQRFVVADSTFFLRFARLSVWSITFRILLCKLKVAIL